MRTFPPARALLAMAAVHACACAQGLVDVAVFNYADVPRSVLAPAAETARRALLTARIESRWVICEAGACPQDLLGASYLQVFVMPRLLAPLTDRPDVHPAGFAMIAGFAHPRAYALYDAAAMAAERTMRPMYEVLGCILIHEVGHLMGLGHQPHGAMRANLEAADMDSTTMGRAFTAEEGRKLRAAAGR